MAFCEDNLVVDYLPEVYTHVTGACIIVSHNGCVAMSVHSERSRPFDNQTLKLS